MDSKLIAALRAALPYVQPDESDPDAQKDRDVRAAIVEALAEHDAFVARTINLGVFSVCVPGQPSISVTQLDDGFSVQYGYEIRDGMSYEDAGDHFGHAILNALAEAGVIEDKDEF